MADRVLAGVVTLAVVMLHLDDFHGRDLDRPGSIRPAVARLHLALAIAEFHLALARGDHGHAMHSEIIDRADDGDRADHRRGVLDFHRFDFAVMPAVEAGEETTVFQRFEVQPGGPPTTRGPLARNGRTKQRRQKSEQRRHGETPLCYWGCG